MATRAELYRAFGPKLIEAIVLIIRDEINLLRSEHALPERTNEQILDAVQNRLVQLPDYPWMEPEI